MLSEEGIAILQHEIETNRIAYVDLLFDISHIDAEEVPYLGILTEVLGNMNTDHYTYQELTDEVNLYTGGLRTAVNIYGLQGSDTYKPRFEMSGKVLYSKVPKMFELFENLTNWLWGLPLLITILATGVYLTVRSGFFQFRHFGYIVKNMFSKERRQEGGDDGKSLTPFQAISIAIGGTVGVSNMSGVATAIATGGPGALFWLWIAALLAMVIKMAEVTLAVYYREKQPNGEYQGARPTTCRRAWRREKASFWKLFAVLFGGCIFMTWFITLQNYTVSEVCRKYLHRAVQSYRHFLIVVSVSI